MGHVQHVQLRFKWVKTCEENQYFVKESEKKWKEYQNGNLFAEFEEIYSNFESGNSCVILERNDGYFVKLTNECGYFGDSQTDISIHFCDGKWENTTTGII
jgi:hypothetical protein